ncbi:Imm45 family immunity protein [Pseudomonas resinovorans]|uniref:Imm45 family immunity protein n=1 Tax=Metapseudomonas resinovorans TaxID=53412 RepID=UPI00237F91CE|nr:Imm45 family immunity protein [Pseudomonas resinovorans]MDE3739081.1 Imm45 family immunity protein [Pseudomonas resinovorans]
MKKLVDLEDEELRSGNVLRFPGQWPYEERVDLMVVDLSDEETPYALVVSSGHKAGLILVRLPCECVSLESRGIRKSWLIKNWSKWVYPECEIGDVFFIDRYQIVPPIR